MSDEGSQFHCELSGVTVDITELEIKINGLINKNNVDDLHAAYLKIIFLYSEFLITVSRVRTVWPVAVLLLSWRGLNGLNALTSLSA